MSKKKQLRGIKTTVLYVIRPAGGYRMTVHRHNEDVRELGVTNNSKWQ
jgi:hypothetical protein